MLVLVCEFGKDPRELDIKISQKIVNHSTGFGWGYSGAGASQLALALLLDYLGDTTKASVLYQEFKFALVTHWMERTWTLTGEEIDRWIGLKATNDHITKTDYRPPIYPTYDPKTGQIPL